MNENEGIGDGQRQGAAGELGDSAAAADADERRMHVRAYNHWVSLLGDREIPTIADFDPGAVPDFAANSVLLDFSSGLDDPAAPYVGDAIRTVGEAPRQSLLALLGGHYEQILAERAPVGFEAEFVNLRDQTISYRGMLMPFSSGGETIDFLYGVVNWRIIDDRSQQVPSELQPVDIAPADMPLWEDGPGTGSDDPALEGARSALRRAPPLALDEIDPGAEFALALTRRGPGGRHQLVALVDDPALLERALRQLG